MISQLQYTEQSCKGYTWTAMGFMQLQIFAKGVFLMGTDHEQQYIDAVNIKMDSVLFAMTYIITGT